LLSRDRIGFAAFHGQTINMAIGKHDRHPIVRNIIIYYYYFNVRPCCNGGPEESSSEIMKTKQTRKREPRSSVVCVVADYSIYDVHGSSVNRIYLP